MDNQDILESNHHHQPSNDGETYPISDHDSSITSNDLIDTNNIQQGENDEDEQLEFAQSLSQDSLVNGEQTTRRENPLDDANGAVTAATIPPLPIPTNNSMTHSRISSRMSTMKSSTGRSLALDEHIKLVKQKKEEAEVLRLQRFQEQLKKKEQKWQQQQLERMKKWLQLRNRDTDHRTQVEERRKKREEEAKAKIDEMIRREKEREQRVTTTTHQLRTATPSNRPESMMSMSTDILSNRRAISASRLRPTNHLDRRGINNHSPIPVSSSDAREETETNQPIRPRPGGQINDTFRRLAKPRTTPMAQSVYAGATAHTIPQSRSSHQLRIPTPPVIPPARRNVPTRPATVPNSNNESRTSPSDEATNSTTRTRPVASRPTKAPRSVMTTSHSSSSLSTIKTNVRRIGPAAAEPSNGSASPPPPPLAPTPPPPVASSNTTTADDDVVDPVTTEEYQRKLNQKIREARQREEELRRQAEQEEYEREQEQIRLVEEQRRAEQERLQRAIEERERENELKRQEELRLAQQREELERRQAEEMERLQREREERAKREEEERIERKRRLDLIMRRTRQTSPNSKPELPKPTVDSQSNGHETPSPAPSAPTMTHSMSENRFPSSTSNENFLDTIASPSPVVTETPKFKSPLIQSLLNKARNTRSTDNLIQTSMTTSQIILDQSPLTLEKPSTPSPNRSDDDETNHLLSSSTTTNNNNNTSSMNSSYPADSVVH